METLVSASAILLDELGERATDFDVIYCHIDWLHVPVLRRLGVPFVTTLHGRLDIGGLKWIRVACLRTVVLPLQAQCR